MLVGKLWIVGTRGRCKRNEDNEPLSSKLCDIGSVVIPIFLQELSEAIEGGLSRGNNTVD